MTMSDDVVIVVVAVMVHAEARIEPSRLSGELPK